MPTEEEIERLAQDATAVAITEMRDLLTKYSDSDFAPMTVLISLLSVHIRTIADYVHTCCPKEIVARVEIDCVSDIMELLANQFPTVVQEVKTKYVDADGNEIHPAEGLH